MLSWIGKEKKICQVFLREYVETEVEGSKFTHEKLREIATSDVETISEKYNIPKQVLISARETPVGDIASQHYP